MGHREEFLGRGGPGLNGAISLGATGIGAVASRVANVAEYTDPVLIPYGIIGGENMVLGDYIDSVCAE